jgi:hypothetical protein
MIMLKKSYCDVIIRSLYRYMNKITDQVQFTVNTDHYTYCGRYFEIQDDNGNTYEIHIKVRDTNDNSKNG